MPPTDLPTAPPPDLPAATEPPYADLPALLRAAEGLIAAALDVHVEETRRTDAAALVTRWDDTARAWRDRYNAAVPALTRPHGAVVDIIENLSNSQDPNEYPAITVPSEVSINGIPLLHTEEGPVVEEIDMRPDRYGRTGWSAAVVHLKVLCRRIRIDAETRLPEPTEPVEVPTGPAEENA